MKKRRVLFILSVFVFIVLPVVIFTWGTQAAEKLFKIAVVIPGVTAGSPIYEQAVIGAKEAVAENPHAEIKVVELGFNQAEWQEKITSIVATGDYDILLTSNPAMPFVCMEVAEAFPKQKFIILDSYFDGHPQMATYLYNQVEQSYMLGYLAGLISTSTMQGANPDLKIGMVVAQEYPALKKMIRPGFLQGAQAVNPDFEMDLRVIGNWYDASKAAELTKSMIDAGVDVIGAVCGGAAQGVLDAAGERGKYVMFWDNDEYDKAPGVIAGCGSLHQKRLAYEAVKKAIAGEVEFGKAKKLYTKDGYIEFVTDNPLYIETIPADLREAQQKIIDKISSGELILPIPDL